MRHFVFISMVTPAIKWKHYPRYRPFVREIHRSPVDSPHKVQWRGTLTFSLICAWTNSWANNRDPCALIRHGAHHDATIKHCKYAIQPTRPVQCPLRIMSLCMDTTCRYGTLVHWFCTWQMLYPQGWQRNIVIKNRESSWYQYCHWCPSRLS